VVADAKRLACSSGPVIDEAAITATVDALGNVGKEDEAFEAWARSSTSASPGGRSARWHWR
jgi:hypothetical protein